MEHPFFIFQGTMEACGFGIGRVAIIFSKNRLSSSLVRIAYPYALSEMHRGNGHPAVRSRP
jgi:hypothetical protein